MIRKFYQWDSLRIFFLLSILHKTSPSTFTIGYLTGSQRLSGDLEYSRPGLQISGAVTLALNEVNNKFLRKKGHKLDLIVAETYGNEDISVLKTAELWRKNVSVYIGPQETCVHEAIMATAFNLPMISYFCTHPATSDKQKFPTFARTRPPDTQISKSVASLLVALGWTHIVVLYLDSPTDQTYKSVSESIQEVVRSAGITVRHVLSWNQPYHHGYTENPFVELLKATYQDTRIYVIVGHYYEHLGLLLAMDSAGLIEPAEHWVIGVDIEQYEEQESLSGRYMRGLLKDTPDPVAMGAFKRYLGIAASPPGEGYSNFTKAVNEYMEKPPFNFPNPLAGLGGQKTIRAEAAYLYDAVHIYASALLEVLDSGKNPLNGTSIAEKTRGKHYRSAMGYTVRLDENGDAEGNYTLLAQDEDNLKALKPIGIFELTPFGSQPSLRLFHSFPWKGAIPAPVPSCGFRGELCAAAAEALGAAAASIAILTLVAALVAYRHWRYERQLDSLLWRIDYREVQELQKNDNKRTLPTTRTSQVSLSSNTEAGGDLRYTITGPTFTKVCIYKGRLLAVRPINKKSIDITRTMKKELKMMRELRHDNLNPFIGACTDPPQICSLSEYCVRGSLSDVLYDEEVTWLDGIFVASMTGDLIRGLSYLHDSPVKYHGNLHTGNCLVDSRWTVRIADYGLRELRFGEDKILKKEDLEKANKKLLYKAPEHLRTLSPGSSKGDIYSLGIILYELHGRGGPWGPTVIPVPEIIRQVISGPTLPSDSPPRPALTTLNNDCLCDCLKECWREKPEERPDMRSVRNRLRPLSRGMKPNIMDNMMVMMEKYANNLEALVDERTDQLQQEKKKTDELLHEMLPRPVADQLKLGHRVQAESYDCVTIYFSDIVGFTSMSAESTPLEVVNFLNDLYTMFDSIIENYDVYKVETIGDAYMVVSGLPIRNEEHSGEIASMALHVLESVKKFSIRHRPNETLKLRIGLHSGPVCAGVVGLKMPRYCLFGDTVNTASRMESTGEALKIHCSAECRRLLETLGGYILIERGPLEVKGKGVKVTHWLIGEKEPSRKNRRLQAPRSSMKKISPRRSPIRKLRFASMETITDNGECCDNISKNKVSSASCSCVEGLVDRVRQQKNSLALSAPIINDWEDNLPLLLATELRQTVSPV